MGEQSTNQGQVAEPRDTFEHLTFVIADETGEQVRLAVLQPNDRVDFAISKRRQVAESRSGNIAHQNLQRE